jgi:hypothetical protein
VDPPGRRLILGIRGELCQPLPLPILLLFELFRRKIFGLLYFEADILGGAHP